jgi:thiamine transport system ATP-binding protein
MHDGIVLENVTLSLGATRFEFQCDIAAGRITAIAGPSGAGKSTLLSLIAGFERARSGRIFITAKEQTDSHPSERPVSVVFQDHNLFAHLNIFINVALGISPSITLSTDDKSRVEHALSRVGLAGFATRMPGSLSGGERQRAAFARALVRKRPVLLLDEPFASLDADLRQQMAELLRDLHRETGNTVVIVTHDRSEIERLADDVLLVEHGRVTAQLGVADYLARVGATAAAPSGVS